MQTGMGLSKILILVGARYTSTILVKNGKLSDILGEIQVHRLAMEVRQLASARQITVLNGNSGQISNMTSLIVPAAAVGALCYGCMWWKGLTFSDLMYVTKRNMENAVSNLTKHLESVSEALAATKRHLTQRIENLDGKLDEQVTDVRGDLSQIGFDLDALQRIVSSLDGMICSLEDKQEQLKLSGKPRGYLNSSEPRSLMGLKEITDSLVPGNANRLITDGTMQEGIERLDDRPRTLMRYELESLTFVRLIYFDDLFNYVLIYLKEKNRIQNLF
ncbi:hypothetical protein ACSBR1_022535 [Camellia fascicularis]